MDERTDDLITTESDFIIPNSIPHTRNRLKRNMCRITTEGTSNAGDDEIDDEMKKLLEVIVIFFTSLREF